MGWSGLFKVDFYWPVFFPVIGFPHLFPNEVVFLSWPGIFLQNIQDKQHCFYDNDNRLQLYHTSYSFEFRWYKCTHAYTHTPAHVYTHTSMCTGTHTLIDTHTLTHKHTCTHTSTWHVHTQTPTCMHAYCLTHTYIHDTLMGFFQSLFTKISVDLVL